MKEKTLIVCLCVCGLLAVSYGMFRENDMVFIIGVLFVIGGYLLIRRKLKESIRKKT